VFSGRGCRPSSPASAWDKVPPVRRLVPMLAVFAAAFCALCASAGATRFYVPSYGSGPPEVIGGFELGPDGSLAALPGSPFAAEGAGTGGLDGMAFTPDGTRAAAAFLFTGGIQGYSLTSAGAISLTNALPGASATGTAITPDGRFAFTPTRDFAPAGNPTAEGVARFSVGADGSLTRLEPPTATGESYGVAITPDGRFLYTGTGTKIARFAIGSDGSLTPLGSTEGIDSRFLGVSPDGRFLFASDHEGLRVLAIGADGKLTPAGSPLVIPGLSSPLSDGYFGIAPDGSHVYIPDSNNDLIFSIAIAADGTPSLAGELAVNGPKDAGVSPDGRFLVFRQSESEYQVRVAAIGPGGVLTLLPSSVAFDSVEPEPIVFQPQPTPVARFTSNAGAPGAATSFNASASERAARYDWDFGDGTTLANGGATPSHVYANAGTYQVTLVVTDAQGCSQRQVYTGQSTVCPGGAAARTVGSVVVTAAPGGKPNPQPKPTKPVLSKVKVVPAVFAPKMRGVKPGRVKLGTTFRYSVSEAATVRFKIERKQGKRFKKLGSRPQAAKAGANKLKWNGKLKGKPLKPGRYRATVIATNEAGGRSAPKTVGFRILPVPPSR
jgi:hypothetical protein